MGLHLAATRVVLLHCNIVNNDYQQDLRTWYSFVLNKLYGQLLKISQTNFIFFIYSEFSYITECCTDQSKKKLIKKTIIKSKVLQRLL